MYGRNLQKIFMEHDLYLIFKGFCLKRKIDNFDQYNIVGYCYKYTPVTYCKTSFVVQVHILQKLLVNTLISRLTSEIIYFNQPKLNGFIYIYMYTYICVFNNQTN